MLPYENPVAAALDRQENRRPFFDPLDRLARKLAIVGGTFMLLAFFSLSEKVWFYGLAILLTSIIPAVTYALEPPDPEYLAEVRRRPARWRPLSDVAIVALVTASLLFNVTSCPHARYVTVGPYQFAIEGKPCRNAQNRMPWWASALGR